MSLQTPSLGKAREDAQKHPLKAWMNLAVKHQLYHSASSHRSKSSPDVWWIIEG